ncbi:MAG: ribonuclease P protein subunit [Methanomicrobiales archaeon]|jgi:ribonuclease P protein subunit POP4|nr:ribonuclease P protein subunit [Methanomicrobiales archaeon]
MITPKNIIRHELVGLHAEVIEASNPAQIGISGRIVDETKHMLVILTKNGPRRIQKRDSVFRLALPDGVIVEVRGSAIDTQPERRLALRGSR